MKTAIYNLIILDESGSMSGLTKATIDGCNETINTIISAQNQYADTQDQFISIYAFQGGTSIPSRYLVRNLPAIQAHHITANDYRPYGNTPLYDAIGTTLSDLRTAVMSHPSAIGSVTIITDGYENSSEKYSLQHVAKMIEALTELGWNFNFIGANINVKEVSKSLKITNAIEFSATEEGTAEMYSKLKENRMEYSKNINEDTINANMCCENSETRRERFKNTNKKTKLGF